MSGYTYRDRWRNWRRAPERIRVAFESFEQTYSDYVPVRGKVICDTGQVAVVRIYFPWRRKPLTAPLPGRYWLVSDNGGCRELSDDEAYPYREKERSRNKSRDSKRKGNPFRLF